MWPWMENWPTGTTGGAAHELLFININQVYVILDITIVRDKRFRYLHVATKKKINNYHSSDLSDEGGDVGG